MRTALAYLNRREIESFKKLNSENRKLINNMNTKSFILVAALAALETTGIDLDNESLNMAGPIELAQTQ